MPTFECPTCERKITCPTRDEAPYRPFCSKRCKLIDLGKWLNEEHRISEEMPDPAPDEPGNDADPPPT